MGYDVKVPFSNNMNHQIGNNGKRDFPGKAKDM